MKRLVHLVLAVAMLITQIGFASVACGCPELPIPAPSAGAEVCPMSGEAGCQCCVASSERSPESVGGKALGCIVASPSVIADQQAVFEPLISVPMALIGAESFVFNLPIIGAAVHFKDFEVPRIRPPNNASHGLRAPPLG